MLALYSFLNKIGDFLPSNLVCHDATHSKTGCFREDPRQNRSSAPLVCRTKRLNVGVPSGGNAKTGPQYPFACRTNRLNVGVPSGESVKTEAPCHSWCGTIRIRPCS